MQADENHLGAIAMPSHATIALLSLNYPPEQTGIAPYTGALADGLQHNGFRVTAHVAHPHYPHWRYFDGYGQWTRVNDVAGVRVVRRLHYVPRSPRGFRRLISEITFGMRLIFARLGCPDVVITVSPALFSTALAALKVRTLKRSSFLIIWVQDIYTLGMAETEVGGRFSRKIARWFESRTLRAADRVVVIHQGFADYVTQQLGVAASRVVVVRNWTHLPPSAPVESDVAKGILGWVNGVTYVVHAGNMGAKQGLETVVDAARLADRRGAPVHFVLIGEGSERRTLLDRARGVSRISFLDPLDPERFRLALASADVLLVNERAGVSAMAVPSKLTSYFDAGRPIVAATDPSGITASEIINSGAGVVVEAGDPSAVLDAALAIAADSEQAERFSINGRRYREDVLDQATALDRWGQVVTGVITGCDESAGNSWS